MSVADCHDLSRTVWDVEHIIEQYHRTGTVISWPVPAELRQAVKVVYRNGFAAHLAAKSLDEITGRHVYLSCGEMKSLIRQATRQVLEKPLHGIGIELGAGCGLLSTTLAESDAVEALLAIEICDQAVEKLIPRVAKEVLGSQAHKVVPIAGSFDNLRLPDASIDFAVEIDSLHHSDNLTHTLSECARVLKPGGVLLCFDRCHDDDLTDTQIDEMLSTTYSRDFLIRNAYPEDVQLTRRENGEHEYRGFEWRASFEAAGFHLDRHCEFHPWVTARHAVKGILSLLPRRMTKRLYLSQDATPRTTARWLKQQLRRATTRDCKDTCLAPRRTTVFLLTKRA